MIRLSWRKFVARAIAATRWRKFPRRPRGRSGSLPVSIEPLETRVLLSVSAMLQPDGGLEVDLSAAHDAAEILHSGGQIQVKDLNTNEVIGGFSTSLVQSLQVQGHHLAGQSITFGGTVAISGELKALGVEQVLFVGQYQVASAELHGEKQVTFATGSRLSTREIAPESDPLTAASTADSGDIKIEGKSIEIKGSLLAQVEEGSEFEAGSVSLAAEDVAVRELELLSGPNPGDDFLGLGTLSNALPIGIFRKEVEISLEGATIRGGEIHIEAQAVDKSLTDDLPPYVDQMVGGFFDQLSQVPGMALSELTGITAQVNLRASNATLSITDSTLFGSSVTIVNETSANASMHIVAMSQKSSPVAVAVGYGQAEPQSITTISGSTIRGEQGVSIETKAEGVAEIKARVSANLSAQGESINRDQTAFAAALGVINLVSKTTVSETTTISSPRGSVAIKSEGGGENVTLAQPMIFEDGVLGIGVGVSIDHSDVQTQVNGRVSAAGSPALEFNPAEAVNLANGTIHLPGHGLVNGQEIVYHAGEGESIGGLEDGRSYFVKVIDDDTIQLTLTRAIELGDSEIDPLSTHSLSRRALRDFAPDAVFGSWIHLPAHPFSEGEIVTYLSNVDGDLGGLVNGDEYDVHVIDADTIELRDRKTGQAIGISAGESKGRHLLRYEETSLGFLPGEAVDEESDRIALPGAGLQTGDVVVYRVDRQRKSSRPLHRIAESAEEPGVLKNELVGMLNVPDNPVDGLIDGGVYFVVRVDDDHIQLARTPEAAEAIAGHVRFTSEGEGEEHRFGDSGVAIEATLEASNVAQTAAVITGEEIGWQEIVAEGLVNTDFLVAGLQKISPPTQGIQDAAKGGAEAPVAPIAGSNPFGISGALAFNFFEHTVKAEVGATAVIESEADVSVAASVEETVQIAVAAGASKPERQPGETENAASIALGVGIGLYSNSVEAVIHGGATVDAHGEILVESLVDYPFVSSDPRGSVDPSEYLRESGAEGWAYFMDGTFSFASNFFNTWVMSEAKGSQVGAGGSVAVTVYDNSSRAIIETGAQINQNLDEKFRSGSQSVTVDARTNLELLEVAGVASLNLTPAGALDAKKALGMSNKLKSLVNPIGVEGASGGIGASFLFDMIDNDTIAEVQDGVAIHTGVPEEGEEGGLTVTATQKAFSFGLAQSGASASEFAIGGSFVGAVIDDTTHARLGGDGTTVTGGPIQITADDDLIRTSVAGGVMLSESLGVGVSAAFNIVSRDTEASIGLPRDKTTNLNSNQRTGIDISGPVEVAARNDGMIWSFSLAASIVQDAPPAPPAPGDATPQANDPLEGVPQDAGPAPSMGMTGIAIAGDASLNIVIDKTYAFINADGNLLAESVEVSSTSDTEIWSFSGAVAISTNSEQSAGIAGAFSSNVVDATTQAFVRGGVLLYIAADSLDVKAEFSGQIHSFTAGGAAATSTGSVAVAGSVSVNILLMDTQAYVQTVEADLHADSAVTATNQSEIWALAGGVAYGGKAGIGAAVAVNMIGFSNDLGLLPDRPAATQAFIKNSRITLAPDEEENPAARARLTVSATSAAPRSAPRIIALTGALAASDDSQGVSVAGMVSINVIHDTAQAYIENSTIQDDADSPGDSNVDLEVFAQDNSWIISIGGSVAVGMGAGVGVAIGYNQIGAHGKNDGVRAYLKQSNVRIGGKLTVSAESHAEIESATVGVAAGGGSSGIAGAGSAGVNIIDQTIDARIFDGSVVHVGESVEVEAADRSMIVSITGGAAFGTRGSVGVAVSYNLITNRVRATIEGSTVETDGSSLSVTATDSALLAAGAVGVAGSSGSLAIGGSITVNSIANTIDAHISNGSTITTAGNLNVSAAEQNTLVVFAGGVGVAGTGAAVGAAVAYNYMGGSFDAFNPDQRNRDSTAVNAVSAYIDASQVTVGGDLTVAAGFKPADKPDSRVDARKQTFGSNNVDTNSHTIDLGTQSAPETGTAVIYHAGEGTPPALQTDEEQTESSLQDGQIYYVIRRGDHSVALAATYADAKKGKALQFESAGEGTDHSLEAGLAPIDVPVPVDNQIVNVVVSGAAGSGAAIVGSVGMNFIHNSVEARISNTQQVTAAGSVKVLANENSSIYGGSGSFAGSNGAAFGASVTINDIGNKVHAHISQANVLATRGGIEVNAASTSTIYSAAVGASAGGEVAVAAAVVISFLRNDTQAFISNQANVAARDAIRVTASDLPAHPDNALKEDIITFGGQIAGSGTAAGGAANSTNDIRNKTHAFIRSSTVESATSIEVTANTEKSILSGAIMGSFAGTGVAIAGAVTVNIIKNDTAAFIEGASTVTATAGDITLRASDKSRIRSLAGQGAASAGASVGAALAYNQIANKTHAYVDGGASTASVTASQGSVTVQARSEPTIGTVAAGFSASLAGVAGSAAVNMLDNDTAAYLQSATVVADNNVSVLAESHGDVTGTGGTVAGGGFGFGGTAVVNVIGNKTQAYVSKSTVQANGAGNAAKVPVWNPTDGVKSTEDVNGLIVIADSTEKLLAVNVTAAIGGTAGVAANVAVNRYSDVTKAYVDSSAINRAGAPGAAVRIRAHQDTKINSGGGVLSGGAAGIGAVIDVNTVENQTFAGITSSDPARRSTIYAAGGVEVNALSRETVESVTVGAVLGGLALAGAASVIKLDTSTTALVSESDVNTTGDLKVLANNATKSTLASGALSAGAFGAGGAIAVSLINNKTTAKIGGSVTNASGQTVVKATSTNTVLAAGASAAAAVGGGLSFVIAVNLLETTTTAAIESETRHASINADASYKKAGQSVAVEASNVTKVTDGIGTAAVGAGAGFGAAVDVIVLKNTVDAHVGANSTVKAEGDVRVSATATKQIESTVVAFAGSGIAALAGAVSIVSIAADVDADNSSGVRNNAVSQVDNNINVSQGAPNLDSSNEIGKDAQKRTKDDSIRIGRAVTTDRSVAAGATQAFIGDGATIQSGGNVAVQAAETVTYSAKVGSGGLSGVASVNGSVAVANLGSVVKAFIGNGSNVTAGGKVDVKATLREDEVNALAVGGSAALVAALGGQVAIIKDTSITTAYIGQSATYGPAPQNAAQATRVNAAGEVSVVADAQRTITTKSIGATVGTVAAGAAVGQIEISGGTRAYIGDYVQIGQGTTTPSAVNLSAASRDTAKTETYAVAAGLGAGSGNNSQVTIRPAVVAAIGTQAAVAATGKIQVKAKETPQATAQGFGVQVGGVSVGVIIAKADVSGTVAATVGAGASLASPGGLTLSADRAGASAVVPTSQAEATAGTGGVLAGINATMTEATSGGTVEASTGAGVRLPNGDVEIRANNQTSQSAKSLGVAAGLLAAGGVISKSSSAVTTKAALGTGTTSAGDRLGKLQIKANGFNENKTNVVAGSGGLIAGNVALSETKNTSTVSAGIGGGALSAGGVEISATNQSQYLPSVSSVNAALAGASGASARNDEQTSADATIGDGTILSSAGSVVVTSQTGFVLTRPGSDNSVTAGAGGVLNGTAAISSSKLQGTSKVKLGDDVKLLQTTPLGGDNRGIVLSASSTLASSDRVKLSTGGLIQGAGTDSSLEGKLTNSVEIGARDFLSSDRNIAVGTYATVTAQTNGETNTYGLAGVGVARANTDLAVNQSVQVHPGATLTALGNINLTPGEDTNPQASFKTSLYGLSNAQAYVRALIAIPDASAKTNIASNTELTVSAGARVLSGQNVSLSAAPGTVSAVADGTGHGYELGLIPVSHNDSTRHTSTSSRVNLHGEIETGIYRTLDIVIQADPVDPTRFVDASRILVNPSENAPHLPVTARFDSQFAPRDYINSNFAGPKAAALLENTSATPVGALFLSPLYATGGIVLLNAGVLSGTGSITTHGGAKISVTNHSPNYVILDTVNIPFLPGGKVLYTGAASESSARDAGIRISDLDAGDPTVTIRELYPFPVGTPGPGQAPRGPALFLMGDVSNLGGPVVVSNSTGSIGLGAAINAASVHINAPYGALVIETPNNPFVSGASPYSEWDSQMIWPGGNPRTAPPDAKIAVAYAVNTYLNPAGPDGVQPMGTDSLQNPGGLVTLNTLLIGHVSNTNRAHHSAVVYGNALPWGAFTVRDPNNPNSPPVRYTAQDSSRQTNAAISPTPVTGSALAISDSSTDDDNREGWFPVVPLERLYLSIPDYEGVNLDRSNQSHIEAVSIIIEAKIVNLDSRITVGSPNTRATVLGPDELELINQGRLSYAQGGPALYQIAIANSAEVVQYDAANDEIIYTDRSASGGTGSISIKGAIISTNPLGNIRVKSPNGVVKVENYTGVPLVIHNVQTGNDSLDPRNLARVDLIDLNEPDAARQHQLYVYENSADFQGIKLYQGTAGQSVEQLLASAPSGIGPNVTQVNFGPVPGTRFQWQVRADLSRNVEFKNQGVVASEWTFTIPKNAINANDPWYFLGADGRPTPGSILGGNSLTGQLVAGPVGGPAFEQRITGPDTYDFSSSRNVVQPGISSSSPGFVWYEGDAYGFPRYNPNDPESPSVWQYSYPTKMELTITSSVKADNPIGIDFSELVDLGQSRFEVYSNASIRLRGDIVNPNGNAVLRADLLDEAAFDAGQIDTTADTIPLSSLTFGLKSSNRGWGPRTGDAVVYHQDGAQKIGGLVDGREYFVIAPQGNGYTIPKVKLAATLADAYAGNAIDLTAGEGTSYTFDHIEEQRESITAQFNTNQVVNAFEAGGSYGAIDFLSDPPGFFTGDAVVYSSGGSDGVGGLVDGQTYFVIRDQSNPGWVRLARTALDAAAGRHIVFTSRGSGFEYSLTYVAPATTVLPFTSSNVFVDSSLFGSPYPSTIQSPLFAGLQWQTGDAVVYRDGGAAEISGLVDGQTYYVIVRDERTINLAASADDAHNGRYLTVTNSGDGSSYTLTKTAAGPVSFSASKIDTLRNVVLFDQPHGYATGTSIVYRNGGSADLAGLTDGTTYYAIVLSETTLQIATTPEEAAAGTAVDLNAGLGTSHSLVLGRGGNITMDPAYSITTRSLEMYATGGIGSPDQPLTVNLVDSGLLTARAGSDAIQGFRTTGRNFATTADGVYLDLGRGAAISGEGSDLEQRIFDGVVDFITITGVSSALGDVVINAQESVTIDPGSLGTHVAGRNVTIDSFAGAIGALGAPLHIASTGVVRASALANIDLAVDQYDLLVDAITSTTGDVTIVGGPGGGRVLDAAGRTAGQTIDAEQLRDVWANLGLTDPTAAQSSIAAFERQVESRYRALWQWLQHGSIPGGNLLSYVTTTGAVDFTLAAESLAIYRPLATAALGLSDSAEATDAQVQQYAGAQFRELVGFFFQNLENGDNESGTVWYQGHEFQQFNPDYFYDISEHPLAVTQAVDLTKNAVWKTEELVAFVSRTALNPAAGALVGTGVPNISGRHVTFTGTGPIGKVGVDTEITLQQFQQGTVTPAQLAELAVAIAPGDVVLKGIDAQGQTLTFALGLQPAGVTVTGVVIHPTAPLFVAATGVFNASSNFVYVQSTLPNIHVGTVTADREGTVKITTAGDILGAYPESRLGGKLILVAGSGSIGSATLPLPFLNSIEFAFAKHDIFLNNPSGSDVSLNQVFAGRDVVLTVGGGIEPTDNHGVNIRARSLELNAGHSPEAFFPQTKGIGSADRPLVVRLGLDELNVPVGGRLEGDRILDQDGKQVGVLGRLRGHVVGAVFIESTDSLRVDDLESRAGSIDLVVDQGDAYLGLLSAIQDWPDESFVGRQPVPKVSVLTRRGNIVSGNPDAAAEVVTTQAFLSAPLGAVGSPDAPISLALSSLANYPTHVTAEGDLGVYLTGIGDLRLRRVVAGHGDVRLISDLGSILDGGDMVHATVTARNIALAAMGGAIGAPDRDLLIDSDNPSGGGLRAAAQNGIFIQEVGGALTVKGVTSTAGDVRLSVPESTDNSADLHLPTEASIQAAGEVLLLVGSDVNLDAGSLVQGCGAVTIQGDYHPQANFSPNRPTTFRILGQVIGNPVRISGNDPGNVYEPLIADVSVQSVVDVAAPFIRNIVGYTISVSNHGPFDVPNATVVDPLPAEVTFVSAGQGGIYDPATHSVTWSVANLASSASTELTLQVSINAVAPDTLISHTPRVSTPDRADFNATNNFALATFATRAALLADVTPETTVEGVEGLPTTDVVLMRFVSENRAALAADFSIAGLDWNGPLAGAAPAVSIVADSSYSGAGSGWMVVASAVIYGQPGTYAVAVTVVSQEGSEASASQTVIQVADAPLTDTTLVSTINATEGLPATNRVVMRFTDANPFAVQADFSVTTVNWGGPLHGATPVLTVVADPQFTGEGSGWMVTVDSVIYANVGTYSVALNVHDVDGGDVATAKTSFRVANAGHKDVTAPTTIAAVATQPVSDVVLMRFVDANPYATASDFAVFRVIWGGALTGPEPKLSVKANPGHTGPGSGWLVVADSVTYAAEGQFNVQVIVKDDDGASIVSLQTKFNVTTLRLRDTTPATTLNAVEGSTTGTVILATFTDTNPLAIASDYTTTVDWGGTLAGTPTRLVKLVSRTATESAWQVEGSATYTRAGLYPVAVTIKPRDSGSITTVQTRVDVADAPLTDTTPVKTWNAVEGKATGAITLATFRDANPSAAVTDFSPLVNWGGTVVGNPAVSVKLVSRTATASFWRVVGNATYSQSGQFAVTVTVDGVGTSLNTSNTQVKVANAPLADKTPATNIAGAQGQVISDVVLMKFTDGNAFATADHFSVPAPEWGGSLTGTTPTLRVISNPAHTGAGSGWLVVADSVTYAERGTFNVDVTVVDLDGTSLVSRKTSFQIGNAVLSDTSPETTLQAYEGVRLEPAVLATFSHSDPAALESDFNAAVDWGGPVLGDPAVAVRLVSRSATASHWQVVGAETYVFGGLYRVAVTINDQNGNKIVSSRTQIDVASEL